MSQYKISKKRLAEIIKEEYQSLNEDSALTHTMSRWAEEAKGIPAHLTVARMIESGDLDGAIETLTTMREANAALAMNRQDEAHCGGDHAGNRDEEVEDPDKADLDNDGKLSGYEKKRGKAIQKAMKKESLDSIRTLIQQELKNL